QASADAGVVLTELRPAGGGLEQLFLTLTAESTKEAGK
ncbi:ABC transporter ATP-binding protein, partial [Micromonospora azadirachtae]